MASNKQNNNRKNKEHSHHAAGSRYHERHAGNVPDYGGNLKDPMIEQHKE